MRYSFIVPLYNRPKGLHRLIESLLLCANKQTYELIVVEDASSTTSEEVVKAYAEKLRIIYITLPQNSGPSTARNVGCRKAKGEYLLFVDSDTSLDRDYFNALESALLDTSIVFAGGAEAIPSESSSWQRAVHHSMCAWLSTGGIRGSRSSMEQFKPRTHNMLVRKDIFQKLGGFNPSIRYGEDIDFSLRMEKAGYKGRLLTNLRVLHYRKKSVIAFFHQVYHSGRARAHLSKLHPGSTKLVHLLPAACLLGEGAAVVAVLLGWRWPLIGFATYTAALLVEMLCRSSSLWISIQALLAVYLQLTAYGLGYLCTWLYFTCKKLYLYAP